MQTMVDVTKQVEFYKDVIIFSAKEGNTTLIREYPIECKIKYNYNYYEVLKDKIIETINEWDDNLEVIKTEVIEHKKNLNSEEFMMFLSKLLEHGELV